MQYSKHCSLEWKRLSLPPQPVQKKNSHWPVAELWKQLGMRPRHLSSICRGSAHTSSAQNRKKIDESILESMNKVSCILPGVSTADEMYADNRMTKRKQNSFMSTIYYSNAKFFTQIFLQPIPFNNDMKPFIYAVSWAQVILKNMLEKKLYSNFLVHNEVTH